MKKAIGNILFAIYGIIAVFTTICLLSYNEYKVTEFGSYSLIIINDDELAPQYNKGELVLVDNKNNKNIKIGDQIFFYNTNNKEVNVSIAKVLNKEAISSQESSFTIDGNDIISSKAVIGPTSTVKVIKNAGTILGIVTSKWGFLFLIVLPSLIAFLYEISVVFTEIKESKKSTSKE